jgi:hypothetical protein
VNVPNTGTGHAHVSGRWLDASDKLVAMLTIGTIANPTNGWADIPGSFPVRVERAKLRIGAVGTTTNPATAVDRIVLRRDSIRLNGEFGVDANAGDTLSLERCSAFGIPPVRALQEWTTSIRCICEALTRAAD